MKLHIQYVLKALPYQQSLCLGVQVALPVPGQNPPHYPNPPPVKAYVCGPGVQPVTVDQPVLSEPPAIAAAIVTEGTGSAAKSKKKEKKEKKEPSPTPDEGEGVDFFVLSQRTLLLV